MTYSFANPYGAALQAPTIVPNCSCIHAGFRCDGGTATVELAHDLPSVRMSASGLAMVYWSDGSTTRLSYQIRPGRADVLEVVPPTVYLPSDPEFELGTIQLSLLADYYPRPLPQPFTISLEDGDGQDIDISVLDDRQDAYGATCTIHVDAARIRACRSLRILVPEKEPSDVGVFLLGELASSGEADSVQADLSARLAANRARLAGRAVTIIETQSDSAGEVLGVLAYRSFMHRGCRAVEYWPAHLTADLAPRNDAERFQRVEAVQAAEKPNVVAVQRYGRRQRSYIVTQSPAKHPTAPPRLGWNHVMVEGSSSGGLLPHVFGVLGLTRGGDWLDAIADPEACERLGEDAFAFRDLDNPTVVYGVIFCPEGRIVEVTAGSGDPEVPLVSDVEQLRESSRYRLLVTGWDLETGIPTEVETVPNVPPELKPMNLTYRLGVRDIQPAETANLLSQDGVPNTYGLPTNFRVDRQLIMDPIK